MAHVFGRTSPHESKGVSLRRLGGRRGPWTERRDSGVRHGRVHILRDRVECVAVVKVVMAGDL